MISSHSHFFSVYILIHSIAAFLVLDLASILLAHKQHSDIYTVLRHACSQAEKSGVFIKILETFSAIHEHYAPESSHAFMLQNCLIKTGCIFAFILI